MSRRDVTSIPYAPRTLKTMKQHETKNYNCNKVIVIFYDHVYGHRTEELKLWNITTFCIISALFSSSLQLLDNGDVRAERRKFDSRSRLVGFFPGFTRDGLNLRPWNRILNCDQLGT